jgi:DnaK suppressor protein
MPEHYQRRQNSPDDQRSNQKTDVSQGILNCSEVSERQITSRLERVAVRHRAVPATAASIASFRRTVLQVLARNRAYGTVISSTQGSLLTQTENQRFSNLLLAKQTQLSASARNRDEIVVENAPDALDQVQLMGERELALRNLDRDSNLLRQIRRALSRIANGSYGACLHCEEDIPPKRLAAVPWAAFCIRCQEQIDRHEIEVDETVELLAPAV